MTSEESKRVKINYFFNLIYQIFIVVAPLITTPYLAKTLTENGSGIFSYTSSYIAYFTLFASMGFTLYGQRTIAADSNKPVERSYDFWEIFLLRLVATLLSLCVFFALVFLNAFGEKYAPILLIQSIDIIAVAFDITFVFQGIQNFRIIAVRNFIIKAITITLVFLFIKSEDDLWIYTLLSSSSTLFSALSLWPALKKFLMKIDIRKIHIARHIKASFILFIPTIAGSIYTQLDKTLIGLITAEDAENGNYHYAEKIVRMATTVVTSFGQVMIPLNAQKFSEGKIDEVKENCYKVTSFVWLLGIPLALGICAVSNNLVPWFLSPRYTKASTLMKILSPIIVLVGLSEALGYQYLITTRRDGRYAICVTIGALINLSLNIPFIMLWQSYGAAIASVIAEFSILVAMYCFIHKEISLKRIFLPSWRYWVGGIVMFVPCYLLGNYFPPTWYYTLTIICIGVLIYLLVLICEKDPILLKLIARLKEKSKRKGNKGEQNGKE